MSFCKAGVLKSPFTPFNFYTVLLNIHLFNETYHIEFGTHSSGIELNEIKNNLHN